MRLNLGHMLGRRSLLALALPLLAMAMLFSACSDDEGGGDTEDGDETTTATSDSGSDDETATATEEEDDDATGTATGTSTGTATGTPSTGGGAEGGGEVDLEMIDIGFSTEQIEATAGEPLTLNIDNTGALEHDFTIEEGSFSDISAEGGGEDASGEEYAIHYVLPAGESGSLTFTADEAGEYTFFCTVAGHREAGMEGTLTVQ